MGYTGIGPKNGDLPVSKWRIYPQMGSVIVILMKQYDMTAMLRFFKHVRFGGVKLRCDRKCIKLALKKSRLWKTDLELARKVYMDK